MSKPKNTWGPKLTGWMRLECQGCGQASDVEVSEGQLEELPMDMVWVEVPYNGQKGHLMPYCYDCADAEYHKESYQPTAEPKTKDKPKSRRVFSR